MKVEELYEVLKPYLARDYIVWLSVEEARQWGMNLIYYTLSVEPVFKLGILAFEYLMVNDELIPIALLLFLPPGKEREISLQKLEEVLKPFEGYVFGGGDEYGILVPVDEERIARIFDEVVPFISRELVGNEIKPLVDGWFLDIAL